MDQLAAMRVFVSVVETGGFTAASRVLGMPLPTVCRKIAELEGHLGTQLLVRSTRKVAATDGGLCYYEAVRRILEDIEATEREAAEEYRRPKGRLTITAPLLFGRLHVLPIVDAFMHRHEGVEVRLLLTNAVLDLTDEHIDVAVRINAPMDGVPEAMRAGVLRQIVCASPAYLAANGRPEVPEDLFRHRCITASRYDNPIPWAFKGADGKAHDLAIRPRLLVTTPDAAVDAAAGGTGLTQLYAYQGSERVAAGELEIVLRGFEIDPVPVIITIPAGRRVPQKVSAFVDFAMPHLRARVAAIDGQCEK